MCELLLHVMRCAPVDDASEATIERNTDSRNFRQTHEAFSVNQTSAKSAVEGSRRGLCSLPPPLVLKLGHVSEVCLRNGTKGRRGWNHRGSERRCLCVEGTRCVSCCFSSVTGFFAGEEASMERNRGPLTSPGTRIRTHATHTHSLMTTRSRGPGHTRTHNIRLSVSCFCEQSKELSRPKNNRFCPA